MDLHIGQNLTSEDVAKAHQMDLEIQDEFNCNCLTYWFDKTRSNVYCLIEAPNKEAVVKLHNKAHKQLPDEIIEVDKRVVKAILGRIMDPTIVDYMIDKKIKVFNDPAFRVILNVSTIPKKLLVHKLGPNRSSELLKQGKALILNIIDHHNGVASDPVSNKFIATFEAASQAYLCALEIINNLSQKYNDLNVSLAIHAGNPVEGDPEIFGSALKLSNFMCSESKEFPINISNTIKHLTETSGVKIVDNRITSLSRPEEEFLKKFVKLLYTFWRNPEFDMDTLCKELSLSQSQLYRKCMSITAKSPNKLLRDFRLGQAREMLESSNKNISETAFECGFNNPSYFTKCFQKRYGIKPMDYKYIVAE